MQIIAKYVETGKRRQIESNISIQGGRIYVDNLAVTKNSDNKEIAQVSLEVLRDVFSGKPISNPKVTDVSVIENCRKYTPTGSNGEWIRNSNGDCVSEDYLNKLMDMATMNVERARDDYEVKLPEPEKVLVEASVL